ncbi:MAG: WSC domain-containing protein [Rubrivivax sp.]|nr:WSC domain-containing protein [Rubrivivax sp.]
MHLAPSRRVWPRLVLSLAALLPAGAAQALALSRGIQDLPVSYQECLGRAYQSLVAEGYQATPSQGAGFVGGFKANHGSYINCTGLAADRMSVIVFVASEGTNDPGAPGAERVRLQQRMNQSAPPPPPPAAAAGGACWANASAFVETGEGNYWTGIYTRRGSSNVFDVVYTSPGGPTARGELTLDLDQRDPANLLIVRTRTDNGYTGTFGARVDPDGRQAQGTYPAGSRFTLRCSDAAGAQQRVVPPPLAGGAGPAGPAVAPAADLGQVWNEVEATEHAVWTRRPGTNIFDASWSNGRVRALLQMSLVGNHVTIRRTQSSDGYDCTYTGIITANQASGTFGCNRFAGQKPWRATIQGGGGAAAAVPSPVVPAALAAPRYLGCFRDPNRPFDLDGFLVRSAQNTPERCIQTCAAKGFKYAGVQYGESCLCGNSYGRFGAAPACNVPCTGNAGQACGGPNANAVFSTGR